MNAIPDSPKKIQGNGLDMSSDSNLEIQVAEKSFFLQLLKDNLLLVVTLTGVVCGAVAGLILLNFDLTENSILLISYPGEIFMRILKLIILPLIVSSLISCSASINAKLNGKITIKTLTYFVLTSLFNACLGIALALLIHPGSQETKSKLGTGTEDRTVNVLDNFLDIGRNMFPDNIFQAFFQQVTGRSHISTYNKATEHFLQQLENPQTLYETDLYEQNAPPVLLATQTVYVPVKQYSRNNSFLNATGQGLEIEPISVKLTRTLKPRDGSNNIGIITFCLVFGTVLGTIETASSETVINFFRCIYEVVMKIMSGIMWLTPVGICSVICGKILSVSDLSVVVSQLGWFVLTVVIGIAIYQFVILQFLYFIIIRRNPFKFYWSLAPAMLTAFATASTAAALPITFQCMDDKLKIDQRISRFILPIGCSINMDGTALFLSCATIFISQLNSMTLGVGDLVTVGLVSTAASMSSASVPSAALVLMLMILTSIGCPIEDVSLLFAVDWLVDRCRTVNNMLGDCYASAVVEHFSRDELMATERLPLHQPSKDEINNKKSFSGNSSVILDMPKGISNNTFCT